MKIHILRNENAYLIHTINWIGIAFSDYCTHHISYDTPTSIPYISIDEGIVTLLDTVSLLNNNNNIDIIKDNKVVISKRTTTSEPNISLTPDDVYNLYIETDSNYVNEIISKWDCIRNEVVYLKNTENITNFETLTKPNIAGLASGSMVAELAYKQNSNKVIFFDYSQLSLDYQKDMIFSSDRSSTLDKYFSNFIIGNEKATHADIKSLNIEYLNMIYDNLKTADLEFIYCDLRNEIDINNLFTLLDDTFSLWISNALYYVTSFNKNKNECIDLIYQKSIQYGVEILPHMRINYES